MTNVRGSQLRRFSLANEERRTESIEVCDISADLIELPPDIQDVVLLLDSPANQRSETRQRVSRGGQQRSKSKMGSTTRSRDRSDQSQEKECCESIEACYGMDLGLDKKRCWASHEFMSRVTGAFAAGRRARQVGPETPCAPV